MHYDHNYNNNSLPYRIYAKKILLINTTNFRGDYHVILYIRYKNIIFM